MLEALAFLTSLGGARPLTRRAVPWIPWVGLVVGSIVGAAWWAAAKVFPPSVAAVVAIVVDLVVTGMLHVDGLADTADGLLPHMERSRRLAVMTEPTIGAFGTTVVFATLLARWAALAALAPRIGLIVALWIGGRGAMAIALVMVQPARATGLAHKLGAASRLAVLVSSAVALLVAVFLLAGGRGGVGPLAGVLAGAGVIALARRRLGGLTGDVLGACGLVAETVGLLIAAARW